MHGTFACILWQKGDACVVAPELSPGPCAWQHVASLDHVILVLPFIMDLWLWAPGKMRSLLAPLPSPLFGVERWGTHSSLKVILIFRFLVSFIRVFYRSSMYSSFCSSSTCCQIFFVYDGCGDPWKTTSHYRDRQQSCRYCKIGVFSDKNKEVLHIHRLKDFMVVSCCSLIWYTFLITLSLCYLYKSCFPSRVLNNELISYSMKNKVPPIRRKIHH